MSPATIKHLRTRRGLTQAGLAGRLGCHPSAVAQWEQGKRTPTGLYAAALARLAADEEDPMSTTDQPLPPRLSESLAATAAAFDEDAAAAIGAGEPESAERLQRIAGHLRRLAYTHRAAAEYQGTPALDPPQVE